MTVLVCGATGSTGAEVLRQLHAAGIPLRALTRRPQAARRWQEQGLEAAVADLADRDSLAEALSGITAVYVATNASPQLPEHEANLARAAAAAGARLLVKLSVIDAAADSPLAFARLHHEAELAILETGVRTTFLRPNGFMQNTLAWATQIPGGVIRGPVMDARWSIVDVRDIAAVAVAVLSDPDAHAGDTYTLTGPKPSSPREQVALLSQLLGRPLVAEEVAIEQAQSAMLASGWSRWSVERMGELFRLYADGLASGVSPDVERILKRPARDYQRFAADDREAFLASP